MLPHSLTKNAVGSKMSSFVGPGKCEDPGKDYDFFNLETDIILEDEEEYDVLNNETFGESLAPDENNTDLDCAPWEESYDLHNDETFGHEDMEYDWEAEHEKFVNIIENKSDVKNDLEHTEQLANKKNFILSPDIIKRNGFHKPKSEKNHASESRKSVSKKLHKEEPFKFPPVIINDTESCSGDFDAHLEYSYNETYQNIEDHDDFGSSETLTNENCARVLKRDKWYNPNSESVLGSLNDSLNDYGQGYSLFASGGNLLQTAGIHIPSVTTPSTISKPVESIEKKFDSMKLQPSVSGIRSVADLEKQWINEAASQSIINADCFRAYNSALFLNGNHTTSGNDILHSSQKFNNDLFGRNDGFPSFSIPKKSDLMKTPMYGMNENEKHMPRKFFFPDPHNTEIATLFYRNTINYSNMNANFSNSFTNTMILPIDAPKPFPMVDLTKEPPMIVPSDGSTRIIENTTPTNHNNLGMLRPTDGSINISVFPPPPPGLTIDPSKMCHVPPPVQSVLPPTQPSSYLTLPPPQVLNGITTVEQQKQLMKMQKESSLSNLSNVDEYAGMMTEREKYWLSGVQLLQINSMDPYKDDYYFTNYQARRKGNRNKNQNTNNTAWKNAHMKDYSPLQFENSLGRVQIGSVVAPRQVIDTCLIDSSPKNNNKLDDVVQEDPIANTSNRKRKALMLRIENMYSKIMALESLHVNSGKNKVESTTVKTDYTTIASGLKEEILNLRDDLKIIMSIKKGKRLVLRFLTFCDDPGDVWFEIFKILDRIVRGDQEHCVLLSYLPYFRAWLVVTAELTTLIRIASYFQKNLGFYLQDKFSVSVIANMIEQAEQIYFFAKSEDQNEWMDFVVELAEKVHASSDLIQKPVVSIKPQILRSHLLKCKKLENGSMSYLLKVFSNNTRK